MGEAVLDELLALIAPKITKQDTVMRQAIPARYRLAATLRFIATGCTFQDLSYSTRIAPNTLSKIVIETLEAIVTVLDDMNVIVCPSTPQEWEAVAAGFNVIWQFPHCVGALDGKHINFRPPRCDGSVYRNYKGQDSVVLLALVDANYQFIFIDVGKNGRLHDASVFRESTLSQNLMSGGLNLPIPHPLPGGDVPLPYVITADDAFPLKENIMKPYPGHSLNAKKKIFNYRLSRARRIVENAFGILANRFRILLQTISLSVDKVELIVYACCLLHNYLMKQKAPWYVQTDKLDATLESNVGLQSVATQRANRSTNRAADIRDEFAEYFTSVGAVPWQNRRVEQGDF